MKKAVIAVFMVVLLWANTALAAGQLSVLWDWQAPGEKAGRLAEQVLQEKEAVRSDDQ